MIALDRGKHLYVVFLQQVMELKSGTIVCQVLFAHLFSRHHQTHLIEKLTLVRVLCLALVRVHNPAHLRHDRNVSQHVLAVKVAQNFHL